MFWSRHGRLRFCGSHLFGSLARMQILLGLAVVWISCGSDLAWSQCERTEDQEVSSPIVGEQYRFGVGVAVDGDRAIVGAGEEGDGLSFGAAYFYEREGHEWILKQEIRPPDAEPGDFFGLGIALDRDWLVIGAAHDDVADQVDQGSAWIYRYNRDTGLWDQHQQLTGSEGSDRDFFGTIVVLQNDTLLVSAHGDSELGLETGAIYVFEKDENDDWAERQVIRLDDAHDHDWFGLAMALESNRAVFGTRTRDGDTGKAFVYAFDGSHWQLDEILIARDGQPDDQFGRRVGIDGNLIGIGAPGRTGGGAAYLFEHDGDEWTQADVTTPDDGADGDKFGFRLSMRDGVAVIGSPFHEHAELITGAAFVYTYQNHRWTLDCEILPSDGQENDRFGGEGQAVATDGHTILVGSSLHDHNGILNAGGVYVYDVTEPNRPHLLVDGTCPGGGPIRITWDGATPNGRCALIFAHCEGSFSVPLGNPCQGTLLGLGGCQIQLAWDGRSNDRGSRVLNSWAGDGACNAYLQLLDLTTCKTSNVVQID